MHPVADEHVAAAAEMISRLRRYPLRTLDALHLAIALAIRCRQLAAADRIMADAARASGLEVVRFFWSPDPPPAEAAATPR